MASVWVGSERARPSLALPKSMARMRMLNGSFDEVMEKRMGLGGLGFEFGVELDADHPGVICVFRDFAKIVIFKFKPRISRNHYFAYKKPLNPFFILDTCVFCLV